MKKPHSLPALTKITPLLISALSFFYLPGFAQGSFQKAYGVEGFEKGTAVRQLSDGYIIGGETQSYGLQETDMLLIRTNANGNVQWTKTFGGPEREVINDIVEMPDRGFMFVAERYQPDRNEGEFLTLGKTDASGNLVWKKIYDEGGKETEGFSILKTPDNHYIVTGITRDLNIVSTAFFNVTDRTPRLYLLKVDGEGNKIWSRFLNIPAGMSSTGNSVAMAEDGSYIITGNLSKKTGDGQNGQPESPNLLVMKVKTDGSLAWANEYNANRMSAGFKVIPKKEGGFLIVGVASPEDVNNVDFCMLSIANDGSLLWAKTIGGKGFDPVTDVIQTTDGGFIVSGTTSSFSNGVTDILLVKTDNSGNIIWAKTYGTETGEYAGLLTTANGGYALTGYVGMGKESFDVLLLKFDEDGDSACWGTEVSLSAKPFSMQVNKVAGAATAAVAASKNPNYKKPDANNILQGRKEVRTKNICQ